LSEAETVQRADALARARTLVARLLTTAGGRGGALVILLALVVAFSLASENFLTVDNLRNILRQYSVPAILAVGQTLVIVSAGIDLSVASTAALSGSVMGVMYAHEGYPEPVALLMGLAAGFAVGAVNGFVITILAVVLAREAWARRGGASRIAA
jgi:ribose transport system permease protein